MTRFRNVGEVIRMIYRKIHLGAVCQGSKNVSRFRRLPSAGSCQVLLQRGGVKEVPCVTLLPPCDENQLLNNFASATMSKRLPPLISLTNWNKLFDEQSHPSEFA